MANDSRTVVFFPNDSKGARVYKNIAPQSFEALKNKGHLLINPDLTHLQNTHPKDWILKRGKIQHKIKHPFKIEVSKVNCILLVVLIILELCIWRS